MLGDLFLTGLVCALFALFVVFYRLVILLSSDSDDRFQRLYNRIILPLTRRDEHSSIFDAPGCLDDRMVTHMHIEIFRIEIIYFSGIAETNSYYFYHVNSPLMSRAAAQSPDRSSHLHSNVPWPCPMHLACTRSHDKTTYWPAS